MIVQSKKIPSTGLEVIEPQIDWFLTSRIYENGGYRAFYTGRKLGPVYPEITAYAISVASLLYKYKGDKIFLDRARECADYLISISRDGGLPYYGDDLLYTFDTGVFVSALFDLYQIAKKDIYLVAAKKSLDWLERFWDGEKFHAVDRQNNNTEWAHLPSIHLVKLAIPLLKGRNFLKDDKYERLSMDLLNWGMKFQQEDGRFILNDTTTDTMVHPHCYATEGYIFAYNCLKRDEYLEVAKKSALWLASIQNGDGSFYRWYSGNKPSFENLFERIHKSKVADATSQAVRIWKLLGTNQEGIERALTYLQAQLRDGGLLLTQQDTLLGWVSRPQVCSWATFFYLHALMLPFGKIKYAGEIF